MPFTVSHAAVVLPLTRLLTRWSLLSAVVIGAMVPDFGLFFPWKIPRPVTHTVPGLFIFCLPLGLATYWLFQYVVKRPVFELLPDSAYARWLSVSARANLGNLRQWVLATCGVLAGAVSHLVLDAFTHEGARGVRMLPMLEEPVVEYGGHYLRGVRLLQDGFSLLGMILVLALLAYGLRRGSEPAMQNRRLSAAERHQWVLYYIVVAVVMSIACFAFEYFHGSWRKTPTLIATFCAISSLRGVAMSLLGVSLVLGRRLGAHR